MEAKDAPGAKGTDWTANQVDILVANYFLTLAQERAGGGINKAEMYRKLGQEVGRSEKSVEWKLRNVSSVLEELGISWLQGLLPAHNRQDALVKAVETQIGLHPEILKDPKSVKPRFLSAGEPILVAPPAFLNSDPEDQPVTLRKLMGKYDPAARDDRNRSLGRAGEEMVLNFERTRLRRAGRDDLADDVRWVSDQDGDHLGYDVKSFEANGEERLLEIKTTNGHARTRFWLSSNQCDVAAKNPETYRVRRVYHFRNGAAMFDIRPPLDAGLWLTSDKFVAVPR
jgi:hypothetical protein